MVNSEMVNAEMVNAVIGTTSVKSTPFRGVAERSESEGIDMSQCRRHHREHHAPRDRGDELDPVERTTPVEGCETARSVPFQPVP
jgi:hypothetical protein